MRKSVVRERVSAGRVAGDTAAGIIDELAAQLKVLGRAQARHAALMVEFTDTRRALDQRGIDDDRHLGGRPSFKAGEFASTEISMAVKASKFTVQRTVSMTRRVKTEAPDAWDAWVAGDIDQDKIIRINRALRRLVRESSKELLNSVVVDLVVCRTPEILGRCLNQFIVRVEPDLQDERLHRSFADRYVSVRPDLDGITFLSAALSSVDAHAIDQVLRALPAVADPATPAPCNNAAPTPWSTCSWAGSATAATPPGTPTATPTTTSTTQHNHPTTTATTTAWTPRARTPTARATTPGSRTAGWTKAVPRAATPQGSNVRGGDLAGTEVDDWDLPASAYRPDPPGSPPSTPPNTAQVHSG